MKRASRSRLMAWWYLCIALGFLLLAIYRVLLGDGLTWVALRVVIAAGFAFLAYREFRPQ